MTTENIIINTFSRGLKQMEGLDSNLPFEIGKRLFRFCFPPFKAVPHCLCVFPTWGWRNVRSAAAPCDLGGEKLHPAQRQGHCSGDGRRMADGNRNTVAKDGMDWGGQPLGR